MRAESCSEVVTAAVVGVLLLASAPSAAEPVDFDTFHSPEHREARLQAAVRRNLQVPSLAGFNQLLNGLSVGLEGTLELPELLGAMPTLSNLDCGGMSVGALNAGSAPGAMSVDVDAFTISCTAEIGLRRSNGKTNTINLAFGSDGFGLAIGAQVQNGVNGARNLMVQEDTCDIDINPSLSILKNDDTGFFGGLLIGITNGLVGALTPVVSGLLGGVACGLAEGLGPVEIIPAAAAQSAASSAFLKDITDLTTETKPQWFDYAAYEQARLQESSGFTQQQQEGMDPVAQSLLQFPESAFFQQISFFTNELLGKPGTGAAAESLVINQAMSKIAMALGDPEGKTISLDSVLGGLPPIAMSLGGATVSLSIDSVALRGADTFQAFDVLRANLDAKTTLNNKIAMAKAGLDIAVGLSVDTSATGGEVRVPLPAAFALKKSDELAALTASDGSPVWNVGTASGTYSVNSLSLQGPPTIKVAGMTNIQDALSLSVNLDNLAVDLALLLAIDTAIMGSIPVGGLMNENIMNTLNCLTTALYALEVPTLGLNVNLPGDLLDLSSTALPGVTKFASDLVNALTGLIEGVDVGPLVSGLTQQLVNMLLGQLNTDATVAQACNNVESAYFVDTGKRNSGSPLDMLPLPLDFLLNDFLGPSGDLGFNRMTQIITMQQSGLTGVMAVEGLSYSGALRDVGIMSDATFSVTANVALSNISSIADDTKLMLDQGESQLQNVFKLSGPMKMTVNAQLDISGELFKDGKPMSNEFLFEIDLGAVGTDSLALLQLQVTPEFLATPLDGVLTSQCPLQNINQFAILDLDVASFLDNMKINVACTGQCSTRAVDDVGAYLADPAVLASINSYLKAKMVPFVEQVVSDTETWNLFQSNVLQGPLGDCSYAESAMSASSMLMVFVLGSAGAMVFSSLCCCGFLYRKHLRGVQEQEARSWRHSMAMFLPRERSLAGHAQTSDLSRYGVVLLGLATMTLFILGFVMAVEISIGVEISYTDGSTVKLSAAPPLPTGGGDGGSASGLDPSSLVDVLVEGNAWLLVLSVATFSGVLPFAWPFALIMIWCMPTTILSVRRRGRYLLVLSEIGKYTLMLPILLVIFTAFVRFATGIATEEIPNILSIDIYLSASWGLMLFCLGAVLGMVTNRIVLSHHRRIAIFDGNNADQKPRNIPNQQSPDMLESVRAHTFRITRGGMDNFYVVNGAAQNLVLFALAAATGMLFVGTALKTHKFEVEGVAGAFVGDVLNKDFSLFQMVAAINYTLGMQTDGMLKLIFSVAASASLVALVFVAPLVGMVLLTYLWTARMTFRGQTRVFEWAQLFHSVAALDVYLGTITLIATQLNTQLVQAVIEITPLAMVCGVDQNGEIPMVRAANGGGLTQNASNCVEFAIIPQLGFFILVLVALAELVLYQVVMRSANASIEDRQLSATGSYFSTEALFDKRSMISRLFTLLGSAGNCLVSTGQAQAAVVPGSSAYGGHKRGSNNSQGSGMAAANPAYGRQSGGSNYSGSSAGTLPPGWERHRDPNSGHYYYCNRATGVITWNVPM